MNLIFFYTILIVSFVSMYNYVGNNNKQNEKF